MPSPFNNEEQPVVNATGALVEEVEVHGSLFCDYCFHENEYGFYSPDAKRLRFECKSCGEENVVRNIEL